MAPSSARYVDLLARLAGAAQSLGVDMGLGRVRTALERLGDPQKRFAAVQIAGTNGKGSTAAMTEAILRGRASAPAFTPRPTWRGSPSASGSPGARSTASDWRRSTRGSSRRAFR